MEVVTQFEPIEGADTVAVDRAYIALAERTGKQGQVRGSRRDAEAVWSWLVAAKGRFPIASVRRHDCRHDEGIGDCRDAVMTVG